MADTCGSLLINYLFNGIIDHESKNGFEPKKPNVSVKETRVRIKEPDTGVKRF
jgi:hypothetical protein